MTDVTPVPGYPTCDMRDECLRKFGEIDGRLDDHDRRLRTNSENIAATNARVAAYAAMAAGFGSIFGGAIVALASKALGH